MPRQSREELSALLAGIEINKNRALSLPNDPVGRSDIYPASSDPHERDPLYRFHPPERSFARRFRWCATRYVRGLSDAQIAEMEDVPVAIVQAWRERMGYPPLPDEPLTAALLPHYLAGLKTEAIAAAGGVPAETVLAWYRTQYIWGSRGTPRSRGEGDRERHEDTPVPRPKETPQP